MKQLYVLLCLLLLIGCSSKKEKMVPLGPLSQLNEYYVVPLLSVNAPSEREILCSQLIKMLEKLGTVHISHECIFNMQSSGVGLVVSADDHGSYKEGSIKILAEGEVLINKYKASCDVWSTSFRDPTGAYPVDTENGIIFTKDESAKSPDMMDVVTQLVEEFVAQYQHDNPNQEPKPVFYIYDLFIDAT